MTETLTFVPTAKCPWAPCHYYKAIITKSLLVSVIHGWRTSPMSFQCRHTMNRCIVGFQWPERLKDILKKLLLFSFGYAFIVTTDDIYMVKRWEWTTERKWFTASLFCFVCVCVWIRLHSQSSGGVQVVAEPEEQWHETFVSSPPPLCCMCIFVGVCLWMGVEWLDLLRRS